jgi:hypothetical protein
MQLAPHIGFLLWEALMIGISLRFPDAPDWVGNLIIGGALLGLVVWAIWLAIHLWLNRNSPRDAGDIPELSGGADQLYEMPVHKAVEHVAMKIDECDDDQCYPSARLGLRTAAFQGRIKMYGKKELKKGYHSDLRTPIPTEFWDDQQLNEISTSEAYVHHEHTRAEVGDGFKKLGSDRKKYWDVRVNMDEVRKEWP